MTKPIEDPAMDGNDDISLSSRLKSVLLPASIFAVGMGFFFGGIGAATVAVPRHGLMSGSAAACAAASAFGMMIIFLTFRKWPTLKTDEPDTPRTRRIAVGMMALIAFSSVVALMFISPESGNTRNQLFSNGPLSPTLAMIAVVLWGIGMPVLSYFTRRNADEVELGHQRFGEMFGFQFFSVAAPVWWIGWRGGFFPAPDVMILFIAMLVVVTIANLTRRVM